jgi:hypothetical protein
MTTILMIQRAPAPARLPILFDFWTAAYQASGAGSRRGDQYLVPAQRDDMAAGLFGHRADRGEQRGRHELREQQERAVGQRGHRGLQVQHVPQRDGDHGAAQRSQQRPQLADARAVRPPAAPHVHGVVGLQHIAAVQSPRFLDPGGAQAQRPDNPGDAVHLAPAGRRARTGQYRQVLADHHRIFDEDRVRAVLSGRYLPDPPATGRQRIGVRRVLGPGQGHIHRGPADVGDDALGQPAAGRADQDRALHRDTPLSDQVPDARQPAIRQSAQVPGLILSSATAGCSGPDCPTAIEDP